MTIHQHRLKKSVIIRINQIVHDVKIPFFNSPIKKKRNEIIKKSSQNVANHRDAKMQKLVVPLQHTPPQTVCEKCKLTKNL